MFRTLKRFFYYLMEDPNSRAKQWFDVIITIVILLSVGSFIYELSLDGQELTEDQQIALFWLHYFDIIVISIFICEYLLRFWLATDVKLDFRRGYNHNRRIHRWRRFYSGISKVVKGKVCFMLQPMAIIDLLAILPFLRPLRFLRMLRLLRLLKVVRYSRSMEGLISVFRDRMFEFATLLVLIVLLLVFTSALIFMVEKHHPDSNLKTMNEALWWSIVTLTTVGYGDTYPVSELGRLVGAIVMIMGIGVLAIPSGILASALTEKLQEMKEGARNMKDLKKHMVICGWNDIAYQMIKELQEEISFRGTIVVVTNKENFDYPNALYKRGDFAKESVLREINICQAEYVIIVAEALEGYSLESIDARSILTTLLIEKLNKKAHIVVEIQNKDNAELLRSHQARCEVVTSDEVTSTLLSSAIISPGVSKVVTELLSYAENNIYKIQVKDLLVDKIENFSNLIDYFRNLEVPGLPIALQKKTEYMVNPLDDTLIDDEDYIFYISTESYFVR